MDRQRIHFHHVTTCMCGCSYFQVGPYRVCKDSGSLWLGPPHECNPETCPSRLEGSTKVCTVAGTRWEHECHPSTCPQRKAGEFMMCTLTGRLFDRELDTVNHFFDWCTVKKREPEAPKVPYTQVVQRIMHAMFKRAYQIMDQLGDITNREEVARCIAAVFFHAGKVSTSQYKCFVGAVLRVMKKQHTHFRIPGLQVQGELADMRKLPLFAQCQPNAMTQMEKTVRLALATFQYTGLQVPRHVCTNPDKYLTI